MVEKCFWFHIADHSYSPWEPSYHQMTSEHKLDMSKDGPLATASACFREQYFRKYQMLDKLDLSLGWHITIFVVDYPETLVAEFVLNALDFRSCLAFRLVRDLGALALEAAESLLGNGWRERLLGRRLGSPGRCQRRLGVRHRKCRFGASFALERFGGEQPCGEPLRCEF